MTGCHRAEICVIGGGPAGGSAALQLARLGHEVVLIERGADPRAQVGESLAPSIWPVLDLLDLRGAVEAAGFLRSEGAILRWAAERDERVAPPAGGSGLAVDRGRFDALIVAAARRAGVHVLQPARARAPRANAEGWIVPVEGLDGDAMVECRFLVDAAGRHSNLRRMAPPQAPETVALYGHWAGTSLVPGPSRVEAGEDAWYWGAPRPDGSFCAMAFVAAGHGGRRRTAIESAYRSLLAHSALLRDCLAGVLIGGVRLRDATARRSPDCVGNTAILVGEASLALDPVSSQGVQAAILSGFHAGIVVHTMRAHPEDAHCAKAFYRESQRESFERHRRIAARFYAAPERFRDRPFWRARAAGAGAPPAQDLPLLRPDQPLRLAAAARIAPTPVLDRDRVRMRPALHHPALERPVAFLEGFAVTPLLERVAGDARTIMAAWAGEVPPAQGRRILSWLVERRIVEPIAPGTPAPP